MGARAEAKAEPLALSASLFPPQILAPQVFLACSRPLSGLCASRLLLLLLLADAGRSFGTPHLLLPPSLPWAGRLRSGEAAVRRAP